jgi:hypothetical protein
VPALHAEAANRKKQNFKPAKTHGRNKSNFVVIKCQASIAQKLFAQRKAE